MAGKISFFHRKIVESGYAWITNPVVSPWIRLICATISPQTQLINQMREQSAQLAKKSRRHLEKQKERTAKRRRRQIQIGQQIQG